MANRSGQLHKRRLRAAAALLLSVVLTGSLLFSRLVGYTAADDTRYIPLTQSNGITQVLTGQPDGTFAAAVDFSHPTLLSAGPVDWFRVKDRNTVWRGRTQVEIFRVSYENGENQITVNSGRGDKIIAPGTENSYTFALENTAQDSVEYALSMKAWFSLDGSYPIPVEVKVTRDVGRRYLLGSADEYEDVLELNDVRDFGTLKKGYVMPYTLTWQWPFEGDDAYDTLLGNLDEGEELTLTIVIETYASYAPAGTDGGIPKTGDTYAIELAVTLMVASAAGLMLLLLLARRKGDKDE